MRILFFRGAQWSKRLRLNRSAGFSPHQRSTVQRAHAFHSPALCEIALKRHKCRAPFAERDCAGSQWQRPTKEVSFLLPGNCNGGESADERGQLFLPLPKGEGRGEGEERGKINTRFKNHTPFPLTLNPSPLGRGKCVIPPKWSSGSLVNWWHEPKGSAGFSPHQRSIAGRA